MAQTGGVNFAARRPVFAALSAALLAVCLLGVFADEAFALFAGGSAHAAALFQPGPVVRVAEGWQIGPADAARPVVVTQACAATDFFLIVSALLAWRLAGRCPAGGLRFVGLVACALVAAVPVVLAVNTLRITAVVAAHAWAIPLLPGAYAGFAHLLVGVAVFLPALLVLDFFLTRHARHPFRTSTSPA